MTNSAARACAIVFLALVFAAVACGTRQQAVERAAAKYGEPRFPSYLKPPASIDEVLPHVRPLARNKIGFQGNGLGISQSGDTVAFILPPTAEDMIVRADYLTDYAPDPWPTVKSVIDQVRAGNYPHFFPSAPGQSGARTSEH